jgi:hypothetical protein
VKKSGRERVERLDECDQNIIKENDMKNQEGKRESAPAAPESTSPTAGATIVLTTTSS